MAKRIANPETAIQKSIIDWLKAQGHFAVKIPVQPIKAGKFFKPNPIKGFPDIFCLPLGGKGRLVVIEVKTETGALKPEQRDWLRKLEDYGVICIVARSLHDVIYRLGAEQWLQE